ncbi:hypothetical protein ABIA30_002487 [Mycobacterium sp. MAA66]|jgi:hypothetical protein|uniref:hypothetical protein n=1 Tax=Mycobacterium sp. MAA66 TaxID=3156297 RepID=UPI003512C800
MITPGKRKAAVVLMGLILAAGLGAPTAGARATCEDQGLNAICQTNGSVSIKTAPEARGSGLPDPASRVGSQGRRSCYTQAMDRDHICNN